MNIGTPELLVIMFAVLLLFGGKKLPELARGLGQGIREFKDASDGVKREIHRNINAVNEDLSVNTDTTDQDTADTVVTPVTPVADADSPSETDKSKDLKKGKSKKSETRKSPETDQA